MAGLLVLTALFVLTQLYAAIPLLGFVRDDLGSDVTFALSASFSLSYAVGFLIWGPVSDRYGRKKVLVLGLLALATTTIAAGLAPSVPALGVARSLQGLAASSFAPVALAYLSEALPPRRRPTAIGAMSTAFLVAGIAGQVLASVIALHFGWPWVFASTGAVLALSCLIIVFTVTDPEREATQDGLGRRFAAVAQVAVKPRVLLLSAAHLTLLLPFVAMYTGLGPHLDVFGLDPSQVIWLRLVGLPGMFAALLVGPLSRRLGTPGVARLGFLIATAGLGGEALFAHSLVGVCVTSLVFVTGVALAAPAMITLFGEAGAPNVAGGMALNGFVLFLGASVGAFAGLAPVGFPTLLLCLAALNALAVGCVTVFIRLTTNGVES